MHKIFKPTCYQRKYANVHKYMKKCSTSLIIGEIQIKTVVRYHYIHSGIANMETTVSSIGKKMDQLELSCSTVGNSKFIELLWETIFKFILYYLSIHTLWPQISTSPVIYSREMCIYPVKYLYLNCGNFIHNNHNY